ncbi:MAG: hypothetical protein ACKPFD_17720, partial [Dolichospermum sp.]
MDTTIKITQFHGLFYGRFFFWYGRGFKVAGIMVPTDGAPQLRLAYFTKPYADTTGLPGDWRGFQY